MTGEACSGVTVGWLAAESGPFPVGCGLVSSTRHSEEGARGTLPPVGYGSSPGATESWEPRASLPGPKCLKVSVEIQDLQLVRSSPL